MEGDHSNRQGDDANSSHRFISRVFPIVYESSPEAARSGHVSVGDPSPVEHHEPQTATDDSTNVFGAGGHSRGTVMTDDTNGTVYGGCGEDQVQFLSFDTLDDLPVRYPNGTFVRCEDEAIHVPGAIQAFGGLLALDAATFRVRQCSLNIARFTGLSPVQLFAFQSFADVLDPEERQTLVDTIGNLDDVAKLGNTPTTFVLALQKGPCWAGAHLFEKNPGLVLLELELIEDAELPNHAPVPMLESSSDLHLPDHAVSDSFIPTTPYSPIRLSESLFSPRGSMVSTLDTFRVLEDMTTRIDGSRTVAELGYMVARLVHQLTGFHRTMVYRFDESWNGTVESEYMDPSATSPSRFMGLKFPASDIPPQARALYVLNRVRLLYDRDLTPSNIVCLSLEDTDRPLDMSHCFTRAMSPIHLKYLKNMGVQSSLSISIVAFGKLWGLVACHHYGPRRASFPLRRLCRSLGDLAGRKVEQLSYTSRIAAQDKLAHAAYSSMNNSASVQELISYSVQDLLALFRADSAILSVDDEGRILGTPANSQEVLSLLAFLRSQHLKNIKKTNSIKATWPSFTFDGPAMIAGLFHIPLSESGNHFITFLRGEHMQEVKWGGHPEKKSALASLEPRASFRIWTELQRDRSAEWSDSDVELGTLLQLVHWRFLAVWREKEAALATSKMKTVLLANVSHELRTPLNAVVNYLEIALEQPLAEPVRDALSQAHTASESLTLLISDLLDLTRIETGKKILFRKMPFSLPSIFTSVARMFETELKKKGVALSMAVDESLPSVVVGDSGKVKQILVNLLSNSVKFTQTGSIRMACKMVESPTADSCVVEMNVQDDGCGIPESKLSLIFEEFEQVESTLAHNADGMGLGLAIVARFVRNMGGQLRVQSAEGLGSVFTIRLTFPTVSGTPKSGGGPLSPPPTANGVSHFGALTPVDNSQTLDGYFSISVDTQPSPPIPAAISPLVADTSKIELSGPLTPTFELGSDASSKDFSTGESPERSPGHKKMSQEADSSGQPLRILVAEDNIVNQRILQQRLVKDGHSVTVADNGKDCTEKFVLAYDSAEPYDVVLVDVQMPIMDGMQCTHQIRAFEHSKTFSRRRFLASAEAAAQFLPRSLSPAARQERPVSDPPSSLPPIAAPILQDSVILAATAPETANTIPAAEGVSKAPEVLSQPTPSRTPIIACTANAHTSDRDMYMNGGMDGFIPKPIDFRRLRLILRGVKDPSMRLQVNAGPIDSDTPEVGGWFWAPD